ncbi:putative death-receptor fusion protein-domain-containing protein [Geopyxis carbonaria]|nr:putative death-receptor fusion protein-domain-containing protein [Geopyxis carbonaria]
MPPPPAPSPPSTLTTPLPALDDSLSLPPPPLTQDLLSSLRQSLIKTPPASTSISPTLFPTLLATAQTPTLAAPHRALACDALSTYLIRRLPLPSPATTSDTTDDTGTDDEGTDSEVYKALCRIHLTAFATATPGLSKALKDLLSNTLTAASTSTSTSTSSSSPSTTNTALLRWLTHHSLHGVDAGEGRKGGFYALEVAIRRGVGAAWVLEQYPRLVEHLLRALEERGLAPEVGKSLVGVLAALQREVGAEGAWALWGAPVVDALRGELRGRVGVYVLPGLLRASPEGFLKLLASLGGVNATAVADLAAVLTVLRVGKDLGLVGDIGDPAIGKVQFALESQLVSPLLAHAEADIRLAALSLIAHSSATTRPLSAAAHSLLRTALPPLHAETDAEVRDLVLSGVRGVIERLASSSCAAEKELARGKTPAAELGARIDAARAFCEWYLQFLHTLLRPGANYQRAVSGMRALGLLLRSGVDASLAAARAGGKGARKGQFAWPAFAAGFRIFSPELKQLLLGALFNPFDDIRAMAAEVLRWETAWSGDGVRDAVERGIEAMNRHGRARDADGVALLLGVVGEVVKRGDVSLVGVTLWGHEVPSGNLVAWIMDVVEAEYLAVVETDFERAVRERPIHGLLAAVRMIVEKMAVYQSAQDIDAWRKLHTRIFAAANTLWRLTRDTLCNESPEGHIPDDMEPDNEDADTQAVLSYAWRAVKESSSLVGAIITHAPYSPSTPATSALDRTDFIAAGELLLAQIGDIRHRGAFSAVSPSFTALCTRCFASGDAELETLPAQWLHRNLALVLQKSAKITRRSAGLPYLIAGVLAAELDPARPLMQHTLERLLAISRLPLQTAADGETLDLPQVHALNTLKFVFTDARLSTPAAAWLGTALALAVSCFGAEIWAIRNCGVMLFTTLTNKLFGHRRSRNALAHTAAAFTTQSFFATYPEARAVLLRNLTEQVGRLDDGVGVEMVYPALSLVARLDAGPVGYDGMAPFRPLIETCMRARVWKVREVAARAYATLVPPRAAVAAVEALLAVGVDSQNRLHGSLCAVRALLERRVLQAEREAGGANVWARVEAAVNAHFDALVVRNGMAVTKAVMLQIVADVMHRFETAGEEDPLATYCDTADAVAAEIAAVSFVGRTLFKQQLAHFILTRSPAGGVPLHLLEIDEELTLAAAQHPLAADRFPRSPALVARLWTLATAPAADIRHTLSPQSPASWPLLRAAALDLLHAINLPRATVPPPLLAALPANALETLHSLHLTAPTDTLRESALRLLSLPTAHPPAAVIASIAAATHESRPYTTRFAALDALTPILASPVAQLALWDLLHDDDEALRRAAAAAVGALTPPVLATRLREELVLQPALVPAALDRLLVRNGAGADGGARLFAEEKLNQWRDEGEGVRLWEGILKRNAGRLAVDETRRMREWLDGEGARVPAVEDGGDATEAAVSRARVDAVTAVLELCDRCAPGPRP